METISSPIDHYQFARKSGDDIRSSFWAGKCLSEGLIDRHEAESFVDSDFATLSQFVSRAFSLPEKTDCIQDINCLFDVASGQLVWSGITKANLLSETAIQPSSATLEEDYVCACRTVQKLGLVVHEFISTHSIEELKLYYGDSATHNVYYLDIYSLLALARSGQSLLAFSIATAQLERLLGDMVAGMGVECPRMLKDILPLLTDALSADAVFFLSCLVGPPAGLNLRNVVWHGFMDSRTFSDSYLSLILVVVMSLEKHLQHNPIPFRRRPQLDLSTLVPLAHYSFSPTDDSFGQYLTEEEILWLSKVFASSYFALPSHRKGCVDSLKFYNEKRYTEFLCLIFPIFEQALRKVYVCVNPSLDSAVVLASAARIHFTTLDLFLKEYLEAEVPYESESPVPDSKPVEVSKGKPKLERNRLVKEIGVGAMNLLWDLFVHVDGPRVRDRLSHCHSDMRSVPHVIAERMLQLVVYFSLKYNLRAISSEGQDLPESVKKCVTFVDNYISCFHPQSVLCRKLVPLHKSWKMLDELVNHSFSSMADSQVSILPIYLSESHLNYVDSSENSDTFMKCIKTPTVFEQLSLSMHALKTKISQYDIRSLFDYSLESDLGDERYNEYVIGFVKRSKTLYCSPLEMQLITILEQLLDNLQNFSTSFFDKITEGQKLALSGELKKRQYATFLKAFGYIDCILATITVLCLLCESFIISEKVFQKKLKLLNNCISALLRMKNKMDESKWETMAADIEIIAKTVLDLQT